MQKIENGTWDYGADISRIAIRIRKFLCNKGDWLPDFPDQINKKLKRSNALKRDWGE